MAAKRRADVVTSEASVISATGAWDWLRRELDRWGESGRCADFWWRDDDAIDSSAQLDRLLQLSTLHNAPLALAVIPGELESSLVTELQNHPQVAVLQHGYRHQNHAGAGQRKLELGGIRSVDDTLSDLKRGQQILQQQFNASFATVLVPPWNRIDTPVVQALPSLGYRGLSAMRVRRNASPAPGLLQVNSHLDPINWRHKGGFVGLYPAIALLIQHLVAKRCGYRDMDEPTGILSHHLVQNESVWRFLDELLALLTAHPAVEWIDARSIWQTSAADSGKSA
jgi:hypothetical protein